MTNKTFRKLRLGDKVIIKKRLSNKAKSFTSWDNDMKRYLGKTITVDTIFFKGVIAENPKFLFWHRLALRERIIKRSASLFPRQKDSNKK